MSMEKLYDIYYTIKMAVIRAAEWIWEKLVLLWEKIKSPFSK